MSNYKKWMIWGPVSLIFIGAGLCFAIEAGILKYKNPESGDWIWFGTFALIIFNTGMSLLGNSVYYRVKHYLEKRK
ncbi:MAG: hypothetical protein AAFQ94_20310 [Bacteroidota bacterium]